MFLVPKGRLAALLVGTVLLLAAAWYYNEQRERTAVITGAVHDADDDDAWLAALMSQNPRESEAAARKVKELGPRALPLVREILEDPQADAPLQRAAIRAAGLIGPEAAAAIPHVADFLKDPEFTEEAAVALSFMGPAAFAPLRDALSSRDPDVRQEALRSLGKLCERAPLAPSTVLPHLMEGMRDPDEGVRAVGATYLGVIHGDPSQSVVALASGLSDPDPTVRRVSAVSLAAFTAEEAKAAMPALRKATGDPDQDVAREAGATLVKLQTGETNR
jgi:HEAT repeat protein